MRELLTALAGAEPSAMAEIGWFLLRYVLGMVAVMSFVAFLGIRVDRVMRERRAEREQAMLDEHRSGAWWRAHGFDDIDGDVTRWERDR
jgi:hypothetical protein